MNNLDKYKNIFLETFNIEKSLLEEDLKYGSIKSWDSIAHLSLITALEDEFDIMFESEDILNFGSFENGKNILKKYDIEI